MQAPIAPQSTEWQEGIIILPGIKRRLYFIPKRDIVSWPKLPDTVAQGANFGDLSTYPTEFVLAEGKKWLFLDIKMDKTTPSSEVQGTKPSKTFLNKLSAFLPLTTEEAASFARLANNDDYVYVIEGKDGKFRVIGHEVFSTETSVSMNMGAAATDEAGTTIDISVTDVCPAPFLKTFDPEI